MLRQLLLIAVLLAGTAVAATAQDAAKAPALRASDYTIEVRKAAPFKTNDWPLEVRKTLSLGPVTCREVEGGGKVGFARDTVRRVDFNGDGIKDYIVNFESTTCGGERTGGFCGSGGCTVDFLVTLPNGRLRSLFVDQVLGYEIMRRTGKVRFFIHHANCSHLPDANGCSKVVRIGYRQFTPMR